MLTTIATWPEYHRTMSPNAFRLSIVVAVVVVSILGVIAFAAVLAAELTDRSVLVLGVILGFLGPTVISLLNLLKTDAMGERVTRKVEDVHHDILNGGLRDNVKKAISEDRHDKANRDAAVQARRQIEERRRARGEDLA